MFNVIKNSIDWNGKIIELETGKIARNASSSVTVRVDDTILLCTVTFSKDLKESLDFFPLSVHYIEKHYAAGKFPGGFIKREGKASDRETLISRLIDRSIRPLFPEDFLHEVSIICQVLSYDNNIATDIYAIIGVAAALKIAAVPFEHTLGAVKVAMINGELKINPSIETLKKSELDLVIAATKNSVLMVESSAKEVNEDKLISAIELAHQSIQPVIDLIEDFTKATQQQPTCYTKINISEMYKSLDGELRDSVNNAYKINKREERDLNLRGIYQEAYKKYSALPGFELNAFNIAYKKLKRVIMRDKILSDNVRLDGRSAEEIRKIHCEINILPRTHGSALFTRGETQSLSTVTLGSAQDAQMRDDITGISNDKFILHYNFPSYSVGEVGIPRIPNRREIGHGKLAIKALDAILPEKEEFPYTIRIVSEITESNGSSSMATVCAATLSMMDAGIPIKTPVTGIAMGLIRHNDRYIILSDISGDEDALGDMDLKVSSTKKGITALQMDIKVDGITIDTIKKAILQGRNGCLHILSKINQLISKPKDSLNIHAPRIKTIRVQKDKIRDIIGPGGKSIKDICERTGAKIDIEDDGNVSIFASNEKSLEDALSIISEITTTPEIGKIYKAQINKVVEFGAFANLLGNFEGLIHVSEITDRNINDINAILSKGMYVNVRCVNKDNRGKVKLSMKNVDQTEELINSLPWKNLMKEKARKSYPVKRDSDFPYRRRTSVKPQRENNC